MYEQTESPCHPHIDQLGPGRRIHTFAVSRHLRVLFTNLATHGVLVSFDTLGGPNNDANADKDKSDSSACSCVGVTGGVVTLPTPVTTVTVSSTSTTHSTATATATTSTFVLKLDSGSNAGQYVVMPAYINDSPYSDYSYFTSSSVAASAATKFYIETTGILRPEVGIQQDAAQGGTVIMYSISDGYMGTVFVWCKANTASFSMNAMWDCTMGTGNQLVCGA